MTIAKKKKSFETMSAMFFFSFFLTFVTLFSTKLSAYLFFDSIQERR